MVTQNMLPSMKEKKVLLEEKVLSVIDLDLIKCLKQIKYHKLLLAYASISELPSDISTMPLTHLAKALATREREAKRLLSSILSEVKYSEIF